VLQTYTIGQLAAEAGVNVETIRYYQRRKLIHEPERPPSHPRRYSGTDAERLRFIKRAQRMGFTLTEIEGLLDLLTSRSCSKTRAIGAKKLQCIDDRIRELVGLRNEFADLLAECDTNLDEARCPIIEQFVR
jgi:MerR family transcriptional regulator, mercuric resistance operon regulatory protein